MIPPQFDYVRPRTLDEAIGIPGEIDNAKILAGGQSLLPILRLRLAYPDVVVVDLNRAAGLHGVRDEGDHLVIGAMTTHYEVIRSELVRRHCGLLAEATATVADPLGSHDRSRNVGEPYAAGERVLGPAPVSEVWKTLLDVERRPGRVRHQGRGRLPLRARGHRPGDPGHSGAQGPRPRRSRSA
jgi:FAD binding domain in molybdopterin dehydrogenase